MAIAACAFLEGSACGVTVIVTVLGVGAVAGAVYVADVAIEPPLADCVVVTVKTPQEEPLQPGPLSDQVSTVLGLELGTGVSVATIVAVPLTGTFAGAESCSVKLLVMVTVAKTCFEGSATLCAVSVALAGEGKLRPLGEWIRIGVSRTAAGPLPADTPAAVILPGGPSSEAFLAYYPNFHALRSYNPSDFYCISVGLIDDLVTA